MSDNPTAYIASWIANLTPEVVLPGQILIRQGDASETAYYLAQGTISVTAETPYGSVPLATLTSPRLVGEVGVLANIPRTATLTAATACRVYRIDRATLLTSALEEPRLLFTVIGELGRQINAVNQTVGLYTNALGALREHDFDARILSDLSNPPPQLASFAATFKAFAMEIQSKRRQRDELASAALIQQSLLPPALLLPPESSIRLHARMRPAREVGGDFYDHLTLDDRRLAFCVGDVCGKGIPASLFMAVVVTTLRTALRSSGTVADAIATSATALARDNAASMFATAFIGILDTQTGELEYANCGHPGALHLTSGGACEKLSSTGLPLGLFASPAPVVKTAKISIGDVLVIVSDGVTEANDPDGAEFGDVRLSELLAQRVGSEPDVLVEAVFAAVDVFAREAEQSDDITALVLSRRLSKQPGSDPV